MHGRSTAHNRSEKSLYLISAYGQCRLGGKDAGVYHITLEKEVVELLLRSQNEKVRSFAEEYKKMLDRPYACAPPGNLKHSLGTLSAKIKMMRFP